MGSVKPFILHAHFYQPERSNPWTGMLDPEPTAAPERDWNERIHSECYRPNAVARIFDSQRRVERLVNNYERVSFNFGPTLLSWMETAHPATYAKIIDGDWRSKIRTGHGNALAQAYNHMILPLANAHDRRTQILWGLADFRHRFNRDAEGMWLPETAVDRDTIDALIDAGVQFTVLAPHQAARVRPRGGEWVDVGGYLDTTQAYRHLHSDGSGRSLAVFFYDGGLAQSLAFDPATLDASVLVERFANSATGGGVVHAAVDGETFGHHHPFGELGLAYALFEAAERRGLEPTNYAAYLDAHPPASDVEVVDGEGTAWSCAHGVGRWYRDCGCSTDGQPGWNQAWRTPLRKALDVVRDAAADVFTERGGALLRDPWRARDDYVKVRNGTWTAAQFLERHGARRLPHSQHVDLWTLLEAQRHAMVMYTSCGWFFSDVSGVETVYLLRSAARVMDLLEEVGATAPRMEFERLLAQARSNKADVGTGLDVWRSSVAASVVRPERIAAHLALLCAVDGLPTDRRTAGHEWTVRDLRSDVRGQVGLTTARVALKSAATGRSSEFAVAAVHLGGLDFHVMVSEFRNATAYAKAVNDVWSAFPTAPLAGLLRLLGERFEGAEFTIDGALPEGRQHIIATVLSELAARFHEQYARLYGDHRRVLEMIAGAGHELPRDLRAAAELTLATRLERQVEAASAAAAGTGDPHAFDAVRDTVAHARSQGYHVDLSPVQESLTAGLTSAAGLAAETLDRQYIDQIDRWLDLSGELGIDVDLSRAQELAYDVATKARAGRLSPAERATVAALGQRVGLAPVAWTYPAG